MLPFVHVSLLASGCVNESISLKLGAAFSYIYVRTYNTLYNDALCLYVSTLVFSARGKNVFHLYGNVIARTESRTQEEKYEV